MKKSFTWFAINSFSYMKGYPLMEILRGLPSAWRTFKNLQKKEVNFYCQSEIEGNFLCDEQCVHCEEYYKPLEKN